MHQVGPLRPLELTRVEGYTEKNLVEYFEVGKDIALTSGVAKINPDYDPEAVYSEEILITSPERICSYDETRMKIDCTKPGKGKSVQFIRTMEKDGEVIVTHSSKTASAVCGRLDDGGPLPVYTVFASRGA